MTEDRSTIDQAVEYLTRIVAGELDVFTVQELSTLLDEITTHAEVLDAAGLAEKYDDVIGKAAERWAALDAKVHSDSFDL